MPRRAAVRSPARRGHSRRRRRPLRLRRVHDAGSSDGAPLQVGPPVASSNMSGGDRIPGEGPQRQRGDELRPGAGRGCSARRCPPSAAGGPARPPCRRRSNRSRPGRPGARGALHRHCSAVIASSGGRLPAPKKEPPGDPRPLRPHRPRSGRPPPHPDPVVDDHRIVPRQEPDLPLRHLPAGAGSLLVASVPAPAQPRFQHLPRGRQQEDQQRRG